MTQKDDFTIYPAIDLRKGQVVRLFQGDPDRQTVYGNDPASVARRWLSAGAAWLHVINLDGAFGEQGQVNQAALRAILEVAGEYPDTRLQFGGGLRTLADIEAALSAGVQRVILGTIAVEVPVLAAEALRCYGPEQVALGIDARQGSAHTHGWLTKSDQAPAKLGEYYLQLGLQICIYTNITRDGSRRGVDVQATQEFAQATGLTVIASGGVASLEDVQAVRRAGLSGVIIGRALYEGDIDLQEALAC